MLTSEYYVYALKSLKNGSLYIGLSRDPQKRVTEHNQGMTRSTKRWRPFELFFSEKCGDRKSARTREKYYKSGVGREFLIISLMPSDKIIFITMAAAGVLGFGGSLLSKMMLRKFKNGKRAAINFSRAFLTENPELILQFYPQEKIAARMPSNYGLMLDLNRVETLPLTFLKSSITVRIKKGKEPEIHLPILNEHLPDLETMLNDLNDALSESDKKKIIEDWLQVERQRLKDSTDSGGQTNPYAFLQVFRPEARSSSLSSLRSELRRNGEDSEVSAKLEDRSAAERPEAREEDPFRNRLEGQENQLRTRQRAEEILAVLRNPQAIDRKAKIELTEGLEKDIQTLVIRVADLVELLQAEIDGIKQNESGKDSKTHRLVQDDKILKASSYFTKNLLKSVDPNLAVAFDLPADQKASLEKVLQNIHGRNRFVFLLSRSLGELQGMTFVSVRDFNKVGNLYRVKGVNIANPEAIPLAGDVEGLSKNYFGVTADESGLEGMDPAQRLQLSLLWRTVIGAIVADAKSKGKKSHAEIEEYVHKALDQQYPDIAKRGTFRLAPNGHTQVVLTVIYKMMNEIAARNEIRKSA